MEFLVILVVVAFAVVAIVLSHRAARRRREALAAWASERGLRFSSEREYDLDRQYPEFDCLQQGRRRYAYNVIRGKLDEHDFLGFDYHYATTSTDSKGRSKTRHHYFSAVVLEPPYPLKPLHIRPEGLFDQVKSFFGFDDIDFESAEFSRRYHVKTPDRRWAYDVLHARTIEFLLGCRRFSIELDRRSVIIWNGSTFSLEDFSDATDIVSGVLERLPEYVIRSLREGV